MRLTIVPALCTALTALLLAPSLRADEIPKEYRDAVNKSLKWIAKSQFKDGHWAANGNRYPVPMTGLAGMALLMEGSTVREGKYADNIRKCADWLMDRSMRGGPRDGLIGDTTNPTERSRYMYGHGFGLLFLASVYGDEEDRERRARLKDILTRAVKYCAAAQSSRGGWYYTSRLEGGDNDEGSVTITQVQALRACRNAGIPVPKKIIDKAYGYLKLCTSPNGAIYYSFRSKTERPAITAAGISCLFNAGEYNDPLAKRWFKYLQNKLPFRTNDSFSARLGHDEYTHYYFAQCVYILGDDGWKKMHGESGPDAITWSGYRQGLFNYLKSIQNADGSWSSRGGWSIGTIYSTAIYCTIMQLDRGTLPIYMK